MAGGGKPASPDRGAATNKPRSPTRQQPSDRSELPGVRLGSLFGIKSGTASNEAPIQLASAAGTGPLGAQRAEAQHDGVQMTCFKLELVHLLRRVRKHYGRDIVVTSGLRSPKYNRRAGGARGSSHTTCEVADIQVARHRQVATGEIPAHGARSRRRRHLLPHQVGAYRCSQERGLELRCRKR